jgi:HD-like signal output (HDOD) protein
MQDTRARIRRIAEGILELPTLPTVVAKIIELVDNPRTNATLLARLISTDPALTARMLKLANSAYYGFPRRIGTINLAIVVLGFNTVRDLALSASLVDRFDLNEDRDDSGLMGFWSHSVKTAVAARMLQRLTRSRVVGEAFVAGLLHDIGRLVIARYLTKEHLLIQEELQISGRPIWEIEHEILGMSHSEVGGLLCKRWNLPQNICDAITWHHHPAERDDDDRLTSLVHMAEYVALRQSAYPHQEGRLAPIADRVAASLELRRNAKGEADMIWYLEHFQGELDRAGSFTDLILGKQEDTLHASR